MTIRPDEPSDRAILTSWIKGSYWGGWQQEGQIHTAIKSSLVFVATVDDDPVGFIRIVTDFATFASITDLYVDELHRGLGAGRALMEHVLDATVVGETICILASRDARGFYAKFGFEPVGGEIMKRDPR